MADRSGPSASYVRSDTPRHMVPHYHLHHSPSSMRSTMYALPRQAHDSYDDMQTPTVSSQGFNHPEQYAQWRMSMDHPQSHQPIPQYTLSSHSSGSASPISFDNSMMDYPRGDGHFDISPSQSQEVLSHPAYYPHHLDHQAYHEQHQYPYEGLPSIQQPLPPLSSEPGGSGAPRFVNMADVSSPSARYGAQLAEVCDPRLMFEGHSRSGSMSSEGNDNSSACGPNSLGSSLSISRHSRNGSSWSGSDPEFSVADDDEYVPPTQHNRRSLRVIPYQGRKRGASTSSTTSSLAEDLVPAEPLMKKTRGRRVPTKAEVVAGGMTKVCAMPRNGTPHDAADHLSIPAHVHVPRSRLWAVLRAW